MSGATVEADTRRTPVGPGPTKRRRAALFHVLSNYALTFFVVVKGVVFVPLYLRAFGMEGYGAWLASGNVLTLLGVLESGLTVIYSQRLSAAYGEKAWEKFARTAASGALPLAGAAVLVTLCSMVAAPWVPAWVRASVSFRGELSLAFAAAGIGAGLTLLQTVAFSVFYAWQRPLVVGGIRVTAQLTEVVVILFGLFRGWGVAALGIGQAAGGVVGLALACWMVARRWSAYALPRPEPNRVLVGDVLRATTPFFAGRLGSALLNNNEAFIVSIAVGPAAAAVFGITDRAFKVAQMVVNPIAGSVFYGMAHLHAEDATKSRVRHAVHEVFELSSVVAGVTIGLAAALNADFVRLWVGPDAFGGAGLNIAICVASVAVVRANLVGMLLAAVGETSRSAWAAFAELLVRAPLMWLLISQLGIVGLPLAMIGSNAAIGVIYCTIALLRALRAKGAEALHMGVSGVAAESAILGAIVVLRSVMGASSSWLGFIFATSVASLVALATALLVSARTRQWGARVLGRRSAQKVETAVDLR